MTDLNQIELIQSRQREIAEELARLQKEADELDIAMRVLNRFAQKPRVLGRLANKLQKPIPPGSHPAEVQVRKRILTAIEKSKLGPTRPAGLPSNFEIVEMILKSSEREGKNGLAANEIVEQIGKRYWPGVKGPQVLSFIYKFAKDGRIRKTSAGKFKSLHKNNEGPVVESSDL